MATAGISKLRLVCIEWCREGVEKVGRVALDLASAGTAAEALCSFRDFFGLKMCVWVSDDSLDYVVAYGSTHFYWKTPGVRFCHRYDCAKKTYM